MNALSPTSADGETTLVETVAESSKGNNEIHNSAYDTTDELGWVDGNEESDA